MQPLEVIYEADGLREFEVPQELVTLYGGGIGLPEETTFANFVATVDGVTALPDFPQSSHLADSSETDRFVVGLLRACADAVLIGSGTLGNSPHTVWTAEHAYPPAAGLFARLRRMRERPRQPTLAVLSGSGGIDPQHPGLGRRALILTSEQGAARLGQRLPRTAAIVPLGNEPSLDPRLAIDALRAGGHELILCEGGPRLFGSLLDSGLRAPNRMTLPPGGA